MLFEPEDARDGKTPLMETEGLLVNVRNRQELYLFEFENVTVAQTKYLLRRPSKQKAPFRYSWFLKVHEEMFGAVWKWAGKLRSTNKNIGLDKTQLSGALKNLENDYASWITSNMNSDEIAARLHHRLVWIHPFENGNGRWARLITNIYLRQHEKPLIAWPEKTLLDQSDLRRTYLEALRKADTHDLSALITFHQKFQS